MEQVVETKQTLNQRLKEAEEKCSKELSYDEAEIVFDKLKKHYKLRNYYIEFTNRLTRCSGKCWSYGKIQVRYRTSYHTLCHEIAHAIDFTKIGHTRHMRMHSRRFYRLVQRICLYCLKHNFWEEEIKKRTEIKIEPEPTKEEIRNDRLEKRKKDLIRYEKKLKYYTKFYNNKIKKCKRSILMLEKNATLFQKLVGGGSVAKL